MNTNRSSRTPLVLLALIGLTGCGVAIPRIAGPTPAVASQTIMEARGHRACGEVTMPAGFDFETPEMTGLTHNRAYVAGRFDAWEVGADRGIYLVRSSDGRDARMPTAAVGVQYAIVPWEQGGDHDASLPTMSTTIPTEPGKTYGIVIAHRQGPEAHGAVHLEVAGAAEPVAGELTGEDDWTYHVITFVGGGDTATLRLHRTTFEQGLVLDYWNTGHYIDFAGIYELCPPDAPAAPAAPAEPTSGGEAAPAEPSAPPAPEASDTPPG